ncbi:MAG: putative sigma-54 modulation protein [Thermoleophilaceae bacterium]|jgi:putative sigma-54 modulation protein|nr:putative sigma-54 modulation protein [Thermoleophilaceae bacterium]
MRIEVKGRNFVVDDDVRERVDKRFEKVAKQVAQMAVLELELTEERNPSIHDACIAEGTLHVKGVTLRAHEASDNMAHSIHLVADDLARQVKRHRDKRRGRRHASKAETAPIEPAPPAPDALASP